MAKKTSRKINFKSSLRNYAGIRAIPSTDDFIIKNYKKLVNFIDVAGIKSPGLTCAPAIAKDVLLILKDAGLVDDAVAFNKYLIQNKVDRKIRSGKKVFPANATYDQIADIIVR